MQQPARQVPSHDPACGFASCSPPRPSGSFLSTRAVHTESLRHLSQPSSHKSKTTSNAPHGQTVGNRIDIAVYGAAGSYDCVASQEQAAPLLGCSNSLAVCTEERGNEGSRSPADSSHSLFLESSRKLTRDSNGLLSLAGPPSPPPPLHLPDVRPRVPRSQLVRPAPRRHIPQSYGTAVQ